MGAMKGWLALALTLLARQATAQAQIAEHWPLDPGGSVSIVNPAGRIRVLGWDADSVAASGRLAPRAGRFSAARDQHARTLGVDTGPGAAELEIHVPRPATVWVKSATATIAAEGGEGTLDLTSQGGSIRVVGTPQDVTAETMDGAVELAGGTGRARVKTVSGDILLRGASQDLGASTLSGRIVVRAAGWQRGGTGVQRGRIESVTGGVRFEVHVGRGGGVEAESQSGPADLRVPGGHVPEFDLPTLGGTVTHHPGWARPP